MVYGAQVAQILYVAAKLQIPDLLRDQPKSARDAAVAAGVDETALERLLRGLAALEICREVDHGLYGLGDLGELLSQDHPRSLHARIVFNTEVLGPIWNRLLDTTRTGASGSQAALGTSFYEYLQIHPDIGGLFDRTMADAIRYRVEAALDAYDFSEFHTVIDIGGGNGAFLLELLRRCDRVEAVVFDLPAVAERTRAAVADQPGVARLGVQAGNALDAVPQGADCYVLSNVIVSMSDAEASTILDNCCCAMAPGGRVLIIEWVMPTSGERQHDFARWDTVSMDLNMLAIHGAGGWRVRTRDEFERVINDAQLTLTRIVPTRSSIAILECSRAEVPSVT
jgi:precorrin-6B methylase 2